MHHPANARSDAATVSTDHNYKLVWTPTWLAWLVDDVVYRNESNQFRGMTKEAGMAYTPGYVPWRAVTMRPLLRTNIGSAPAITGKLKAACGSLAAGTEVTVPAGLIQVRQRATPKGETPRVLTRFLAPDRFWTAPSSRTTRSWALALPRPRPSTFLRTGTSR